MPFIEALGTVQGFYTELGIDIFKDAVSLPCRYLFKISPTGYN